MKTLIIILLLSVIPISAWADKPSHEYSDEEIVEAIGKAENSVKYPYGIKSLKYEDRSDRSLSKKDWAKMICLNSIRNARKRWEKAGKPEDFIFFMSRRFCPINAPDDPNGFNVNWKRNVHYFLRRRK